MVFLHGLGQTPQSFSEQVRELPGDLPAAAPWLRGMRPGSTNTFSLRDSAAEVSSAITMHAADRAYLVGISLGALVALQAGLDDHRVAGLVLAAAPVSPPAWVLKMQGLALRLASRRRLAAQGLNKDALREVTRAMAETDVSGRLEELSVPTLLLCGSRDRANQPAARLLSERIADARLEIIEGGPALNTDNPTDFNRFTFEFVAGLRTPSAG
jgi:3-oxoadipate enol-lactonase